MIKTKAIATFFLSPLWFYSLSVLTLSVRDNGFNFHFGQVTEVILCN